MTSRRLQDIPIRPRYGLTDEEGDGGQGAAAPPTTATVTMRTRKTSSSSAAANGSEQMAASYSEIPFLAQYPDRVPSQDLVPPPRRQATNNDDGDDDDEDDDEDDDDLDDDDNSKDSSGEDNKTPRRPNSLHCDSSFPYELDGAASNDGEMRHFVAENLEDTLRSATPSSVSVQRRHGMEPSSSSTYGYGGSHNSTPLSAQPQHHVQFMGALVPQIDANVLGDIELEAQYLSASVDNLLENLCSLLHSISSITADNVEVHKNSVNKLTDSMDANIKCMYTIMAKTEEITNTMRPIEQLGQRIREIKRLVEMLDNAM